jgi:hypothetical protein
MLIIFVTFEESKGIFDPDQRPMRVIKMDHDTPKTISVPEAGRQYFDLAKNASYAAAARGEIPVIKIGSRLRVPVVALERMLAEAGSVKAA